MFFEYLIDRFYIKNPRLRKIFTSIITKNQNKIVHLFDTKIQLNSRLENGYLRAEKLTQSSSFLRDELSVILNICSCIRDHSTFIDVGSNIGVFSSIISKISKLKNGINVIAFEVDPKTYERLSINSRIHEFECNNVALSNKSEQKTFVRGAVSHVTAEEKNISKYNISTDTFIAKSIRADNLDIGHKPKFFKVDVEGSELEVLEGCHGFLENNEIYGFYFDGIADWEKVTRILRNYGFKLLNGRTLEAVHKPCFSLLALRDL